MTSHGFLQLLLHLAETEWILTPTRKHGPHCTWERDIALCLACSRPRFQSLASPAKESRGAGDVKDLGPCRAAASQSKEHYLGGPVLWLRRRQQHVSSHVHLQSCLLRAWVGALQHGCHVPCTSQRYWIIPNKLSTGSCCHRALRPTTSQTQKHLWKGCFWNNPTRMSLKAFCTAFLLLVRWGGQTY